MDISEKRQQIARALSALESALEDLVGALSHSDSAIFLRLSDERASIRQACEAYSAINYKMDDAVGDSAVCLGVLGVSSQVLRQAEVVNDLKAAFKAMCAPLHGVSVRIPVKRESTPTRAVSAMRVILRNIQRSDLNLLAAYRKIPILGAPPATIVYTRANTRAVYRKSIDELYGLLYDSDGPLASADRARLATLDPGETHLALVKQRYKNVRANVLLARLDSRGRGRLQIAAELPLMYAHGRGIEPPAVQFPGPDDTGATLKRQRQPKIEDSPFLQSIPVYRYRH